MMVQVLGSPGCRKSWGERVGDRKDRGLFLLTFSVAQAGLLELL